MYYFIASLFKFFISLFIPKYFRNLFTHYLILNKEIEILKRQQKKRITFTHVDSLQLKNENIFWGCRKISNEIRKIGIEIDKVTIWRILKHYRKQGKVITTQGWSKFLKLHAETIFAMDFFTVDTLFNIRFFVFFIIHHKTREIIHFQMTTNP